MKNDTDGPFHSLVGVNLTGEELVALGQLLEVGIKELNDDELDTLLEVTLDFCSHMPMSWPTYMPLLLELLEEAKERHPKHFAIGRAVWTESLKKTMASAVRVADKNGGGPVH